MNKQEWTKLLWKQDCIRTDLEWMLFNAEERIAVIKEEHKIYPENAVHELKSLWKRVDDARIALAALYQLAE